MTELKLDSDRPGLLVSVRDADEAVLAIGAGADVIDVKEPARGSLGAADATTIAAVVEAVSERALVSAALGELREQSPVQVPTGVAFVKIGLANCGRDPDWQRRWQCAIRAVQRCAGESPQPVAVIYADWRAANAPNPNNVLRAATEVGCPGLLIDTWDKTSGNLFDLWPSELLRDFLDRARAQLGFVVLAGSLEGDSFRQAVEISPNLVAVRGAACTAGRDGKISAQRVHDLKDVIRRVSFERVTHRSFSASKLLNSRTSAEFP